VTSPLDGDPRLLNRKFDIEWQMSGPGVRLPFTLSTPRIIGGAEIRPTLTFEALQGDFDLRFLNQRETGPSDSLHGRGPMYGVELAVRTESPTWFAEAGYRFHSLPSIDVERSQPFTSPGARVLLDESRLSRETHDAFTRIGYSFSQDLRSYTGVRYRKADVEVEDNLRFTDVLQRETALRSRTKLNSSVTEAIVGMEVRRGSLMGRTEITFNDKDYGVLATVTYVPNKPPIPPPFEAPVVTPTLKLFWDLASIQMRDPSVVPRLLSTNPREPERTLDSLGVGFARYRKRLAKAPGVRPIILFVNHGTDPIEEARRRNLPFAPWPPVAPPAILSGPEVDTLIIFQPLTSAQGVPAPTSAVVRAQIASVAGLAGLSFAEDDPQHELNQLLPPKMYKVEPDKWTQFTTFHHERCVDPVVRPYAVRLVTKLTYRGGGTEFDDRALSDLRWGECNFSADKKWRSITLDQKSRRRSAGGRVVIASSYFYQMQQNYRSILLARSIGVQ